MHQIETSPFTAQTDKYTLITHNLLNYILSCNGF